MFRAHNVPHHWLAEMQTTVHEILVGDEGFVTCRILTVKYGAEKAERVGYVSKDLWPGSED